MRASRKIIVLLITISTGLLLAQGTPELSLRINEEKVNMKADEAAGKVKIIYSPGDTIRYTIIAKNIGDGIMSEARVVDPIPAGTSYIAESATGEAADITFSINAGQIYLEWPPTYTVRDTAGKTVVKKATPKMITNIKWQISEPLEPGSEKKLSFDVLVE